MPVNTGRTALEAANNCALCCVAGITDSDAETLRGQVTLATGAAVVDIAELFMEFTFRKLNVPRSILAAATLRAQIQGMQHWLNFRCFRRTNLVRPFENLMTAADLNRHIQASAVGTDFIVMIGEHEAGVGIINAHFLTARRGPAAYPHYRDYQLDVPPAMAGLLAAQTGQPEDHFRGGPNLRDGPRRPFNAASLHTDRCLALSVAPAEAVAEDTSCVKCCYITTATCAAMGLPDDCDELQALRHYRDAVLLATPQGEREVAEYYASAPAIVAALDRRADAPALYRLLYEQHIRPAAAAAARGDHATAHTLFRSGLERAAAFVAPASA